MWNLGKELRIDLKWVPENRVVLCRVWMSKSESSVLTIFFLNIKEEFCAFQH